MTLRQRIEAVPRPVRRGIQVAVAVAVAGGLLWPQVSDAREALDAAADIDARLLALGAALQAAAVASQALMTRALLPESARPGRPDMVRIELAAMAASHTIPGGTAAGTALAFSRLHEAGVPRSDAGLAVGIRGLGSALVLNVLLWMALVVSIPLHGLDPLYSLAALGGVLVLATIGGLGLALLRYEEGTSERLRAVAARLPLVESDDVPAVVHRVSEQLRALVGDRSLLSVAAGWSAAYWLLGAASLWVFVSAFGEQPRVDELLVAYGVANVVAFIPVTPRGLGTLEFTLITVLAGFGVDRGAVVLGVLGWRLVNFWAPIPLGGLSYLSLRLYPPPEVEPQDGR